MLDKEIIETKLLSMIPLIVDLLNRGYKVEVSRSRSGIKVYYGHFRHVDSGHIDTINP